MREFKKRPMKRRERRFRKRPMIAYDLETTRIREGTPKPLYITAHGDDFDYAGPIESTDHLRLILTERFLTDELSGVRYVGWNANHFDVYFIVMALITDERYLLRPYLNRKRMMRGLRVIRKLDCPLQGKPLHCAPGQTQRYKYADGKTGIEPIKTLSNVNWEFLDGMAMVTAAPMKLEKFLKLFAPDKTKLKAPDFNRRDFDPKNKADVAYAIRDSVGLYHGLHRVQNILTEHFDATLQPTIGNLGIKLMTANLPHEAICWLPAKRVESIIRDYVFRGGFVWCARRYNGPVWKYDINQAYAAAMRDAWLPSGSCIEVGELSGSAMAAIYRVRASKKINTVPFYYTGDDGKRRYGFDAIEWTWLTSIEVNQLRRERWNVEIERGYVWSESFTMKDYVNKLERLRHTDPDGPSGALGTIAKYIGNSSYGKTVEQLSGMDIVISAVKVPGYRCLAPEDAFGSLMWFKLVDSPPRDYHQPQIGAFITAYVRMVVRRAALAGGDSWLYSDTDCCMFARPVNDLDIDPKRYGAWKCEAAGDLHLIIDKKVYMKRGTNEQHAKGMNVNRLTEAHFVNWYNGKPPKQKQLQRANLMKVLAGENMFTIRVKVGSRKIGVEIGHEKA